MLFHGNPPLFGCVFQYEQSVGFSLIRRAWEKAFTVMRLSCGETTLLVLVYPPKGFSLRRRWAALAARMRCRLRSSRYHYYIKTTPLRRLHLISQLSLTASPPRGSLLGDRIFQPLPITASNFFTQQMPAGQQTAQLDARAGEARPRGKYSRERMALAPIRSRRIFPAPRVASDPFQFLSN